MTHKEMFEKVRDGLFAQGKKSTKNGMCAYRGENDTKCAIGILIADEYYDKTFEGIGISPLGLEAISSKEMILRGAIAKSLGRSLDKNDLSFFGAMQYIHDTFEPLLWAGKLSEYAEEHFSNDEVESESD